MPVYLYTRFIIRSFQLTQPQQSYHSQQQQQHKAIKLSSSRITELSWIIIFFFYPDHRLHRITMARLYRKISALRSSLRSTINSWWSVEISGDQRLRMADSIAALICVAIRLNVCDRWLRPPDSNSSSGKWLILLPNNCILSHLADTSVFTIVDHFCRRKNNCHTSNKIYFHVAFSAALWWYARSEAESGSNGQKIESVCAAGNAMRF